MLIAGLTGLKSYFLRHTHEKAPARVLFCAHNEAGRLDPRVHYALMLKAKRAAARVKAEERSVP